MAKRKSERRKRDESDERNAQVDEIIDRIERHAKEAARLLEESKRLHKTIKVFTRRRR